MNETIKPIKNKLPVDSIEMNLLIIQLESSIAHVNNAINYDRWLSDYARNEAVSAKNNLETLIMSIKECINVNESRCDISEVSNSN